MDGTSMFSGMPALKAKDEAMEAPASVYKEHAITLMTQKVRPLLLRLRRFAASIGKKKYILV
jgi:hypothetical protein